MAQDMGLAAQGYEASARAGYFRGQYNHASLLAAQGHHDEARIWFDRALAGAPPASRAQMAAGRDQALATGDATCS